MTADFRDNWHERRGRLKQIGPCQPIGNLQQVVNADRR